MTTFARRALDARAAQSPSTATVSAETGEGHSAARSAPPRLGYPNTDDTIRAMWRTHSVEEIAKAIGKSRTYVSARGREIGLPARTYEINGQSRASIGGSANARAAALRPVPGSGMTPAQVLWARHQAPGNPEARLILGMHKEAGG